MARKRITGTKANIRRVLKQADQTDVDEGRVAYFRYHEMMKKIAAYWSVPFDKTVAVFCALSPNSDYTGNLRSAVSVIRGFVEGVDVNRVRVNTYNHCRDRAFSYLTGVDFMQSAKGLKIKSFYSNILNPLDPHPVTIDGHAVNIWSNRHVTLKGIVGGFKYGEVADDYREVAKEIGLIPCQVQSITWFTWKRINEIIYAGRQLHLWRDNYSDLWNTLRNPEDIKPFDYYETPTVSTLRNL